MYFIKQGWIFMFLYPWYQIFVIKPLIIRDVSLPFKFNKTFTEEHKKMVIAKVWSL